MFKTNTSATSFDLQHETHKETVVKFSALIIILLSYFGYMTWEYGASTGFGVSLLTWSFFVLCTPVADGGFILAFPIRLLFNIKMSITQIVIWFVAIGINIFMLLISPSTYHLTFLSNLLHRILTEPFPYWSILLISALGTFLSIYFGDEMMDVTSHSSREKLHRHGFKYRIILVLGLGIITVVAYYHLLSSLNIQIPTS